MRNAIILHGCPTKNEYYNPRLPSESNAHWLPWLQKELLIRDIHAVTPEVPNAYDPQWEVWVREVERYPIGPETILIGHSCGGGFWAKYLSLHPELVVSKVVLVAPWLDPDHTIDEHFFAFDLDPQLATRTSGLVIFRSDDDSESVNESIDYIHSKVANVRLREFSGHGHFTYEDLNDITFPALLDEIVR